MHNYDHSVFLSYGHFLVTGNPWARIRVVQPLVLHSCGKGSGFQIHSLILHGVCPVAVCDGVFESGGEIVRESGLQQVRVHSPLLQYGI